MDRGINDTEVIVISWPYSRNLRLICINAGQSPKVKKEKGFRAAAHNKADRTSGPMSIAAHVPCRLFV